MTEKEKPKYGLTQFLVTFAVFFLAIAALFGSIGLMIRAWQWAF